MPKAATIVEAERNRHWSREEILAYIKSADALISLMQQEERQATTIEIEQIIALKKEACFKLEGLQNLAGIKTELIAYIDKQDQLNELMTQKYIHLATEPQKAKAYAEQIIVIDRELKQIAADILQKPVVQHLCDAERKERFTSLKNLDGHQTFKTKLEQGKLGVQDIYILFHQMQIKAHEKDLSHDHGHHQTQ